MSCPSGKNSYETKSLAEQALLELRGRRYFRDGEGPKDVYQCMDCGDWHFTSKGEMNPILKQPENVQNIQRNREASFWERKLR